MTNFESGGLSRRGFLKGVGAVALEAAAGSFIPNEVQAEDMSLLDNEIKVIEKKIGFNNREINMLLALSSADIEKINKGEEVVLSYKNGEKLRTNTAYQSGLLSTDAKQSITTGAVLGGMAGGSLAALSSAAGNENEGIIHDTANAATVGIGGAAVGAVIGGLAADFSTGILQNFIESVKNKNEKITDEDIIKEVKILKAENETLSRILEQKVNLLGSKIKIMAETEQIRKKEIEKRVK